MLKSVRKNAGMNDTPVRTTNEAVNYLNTAETCMDMSVTQTPLHHELLLHRGAAAFVDGSS